MAQKQPGRKYKIIEAANARDGYEAFVNARPDIIILDFMMYGKDGFQLLVEMKREHTQLPPIIFITAMQDHFIRTDALAMGVNSHLDKAVLTAEALYEAVNKALLK